MINERCNAIVNDDRFIRGIIFAILLNSVLIGWDSYEVTATSKTLQSVLLIVFTIELCMRFMGRKNTTSYFKDPWNLFDILVVGSAFVPAVPSYFTVLRVLRVLRILRLVRSMPQLRIIVEVLLRSARSMLYIFLLMLIAFYVYALIGVELFGGSQQAGTLTATGDPWENYETLHEAFFSLFRSMTCEDWTDLRYEGINAGNNYWVVTIYHVSWIVISTFLMINLVVGAILSNYQAVIDDEAKSETSTSDLELLKVIDTLQKMLSKRSDELAAAKAGGDSKDPN